MKRFNMKKAVSLLLILCLVLTVSPLALAAPEDSGPQPARTPVRGADGSEKPVKLSEEQLDRLTDSYKDESRSGEGISVSAKEIEKPEGLDLTAGTAQEAMAETARPADTDMVHIIVELEAKSLLDEGYTTQQITGNSASVNASVQRIREGQVNAIAAIEQAVEQTRLPGEVEVKYQYDTLFNGLAIEAPYGALDKIRDLKIVKSAIVAPVFSLPEDMSFTYSGQNVSSPSTYATKEGVGSVLTWDAGYTGKGMKIAIVDTGLDLDHPSFADAPEGASFTVEDISKVITRLNAYETYGGISAVGLKAENLYRSAKVPYGFNYVDNSLDVTHDNDTAGDHGTHVAGISAANRLDTTDVVGVAPDAQVMVMKVFGANGGAYGEDILAAVEDALILGADSINLSLGSPGGFTSESPLSDAVFSQLLENASIAAIAGGNSYSSAYMNGNLGTNKNYASDPDNGIVSSPASYVGATMVASVENTSMKLNYLTVGEKKIGYFSTSSQELTSLAGRELEYVAVPGLGEAKDYEGLDVEGKVALVKRGVTAFTDKQKNAFDNGAVALLVYDNVDGALIGMEDGGLLPHALITQADGLYMVETAGGEGQTGKLTIADKDDIGTVENPVAGQMSDFSSWGVTPDLILSPDVTAPGGQIYSSVDDGQYGLMSGTSMASPHIAGMSALVLQYLKDKHPELSAAQTHTVAEALIMSTAEPLVDPNGILYSPRSQGAGSANVFKAVTSPAYLTVEADGSDEITPKVSLGDDARKKGVYSFQFEINNFSDKDESYLLDGSVLTDQVTEIDGVKFMGETGHMLDAAVTFASGSMKRYDVNGDGRLDLADVQLLLDAVNGVEELENIDEFDYVLTGKVDTADAQFLYEQIGREQRDSVVTVPAGKSVTVNVTVTLTDADRKYMDENYVNGIYVDGFVRCYSQRDGGVDLSLPFMAFYGDWSQAPIFDHDAWYPGGNDENVYEYTYQRYPNIIFTNYGGSSSNLGLNPYVVERRDDSHNVLSPNGDGYLDYVEEIYLGMLRGAELVTYNWTREGENLFTENYLYARKSYFMSGYNSCLPLIYTDYCEPYTFLNEAGEYEVKDGDRLTLRIDGYIDDGDLDAISDLADVNTAWRDDTIEIPVIIDTQKPTVDLSTLKLDYDESTGKRSISFKAMDNYDIAAIVVTTPGGGILSSQLVDDKADTMAEYTLDVTGFGSSFLLAVCDYGCNEAIYEITFTQGGGLGEQFYAFRRYSYPTVDGYLYQTDQLNGWYSFEDAGDMLMLTSQAQDNMPDVYAAEYVDGYVIAFVETDSGTGWSANPANRIMVMKAGEWNLSNIGDNITLYLSKLLYGDFEPNPEAEYIDLKMVALDAALNINDGKLYVLANAVGGTTGVPAEGVENILLTVDYSGKTNAQNTVDYLGIIKAEDNDDFLALTLACDNDGTLYTIDQNTGKLYTVDPETLEATVVGEGKGGWHPASYTQSMTYDHENEKLYWAGYGGVMGGSFFLELETENGGIVASTNTQDRAELVGLFIPYDDESTAELLPDDAKLTSLTISDKNLYMRVGGNKTLTVSARPYYADIGKVEWESDNESVATVTQTGIVLATGVGTAEITATAGGKSVSCQVSVNDIPGGVMYAYSTDSWRLVDGASPATAALITDAPTDIQFTAATWLHNKVYAVENVDGYDEDYNDIYTSTLYSLDSTLTPTKVAVISETEKVPGIAYNYADGNMYAVMSKTEMVDTPWGFPMAEYSYVLARLNPVTGSYEEVAQLEDYVSDVYGFTIDYDGNFYIVEYCEDEDNWEFEYNYETVFARYTLDDGELVPGDMILSPTGYSDPTAILYSKLNGGIMIVTNPGGQSTLSFLNTDDVESLEDATYLTIGPIGNARSVTALVAPITDEPETPSDIAPESITLDKSEYTVSEGNQITVIAALEPWNAAAQVTYTMADPAVATVDENGVVTGVSIGETSLTVSATGMGMTVSAKATVTVTPSMGVLYGVGLYDWRNNMPIDAWNQIPIEYPSDAENIAPQSDMDAGAYYNGNVYGFGYNNSLKIDAGSWRGGAFDALEDYTMSDMAFDYTKGVMFGIAKGDGMEGALVEMDTDTGEVYLVGDTGETLAAIAVDKDGTIYVLTSDGYLKTLDPDTLELEEVFHIGSVGGTYAQSMTYDYNNDTIYWADSQGTLSEIDVDSQSVKPLGTIGYSGGTASYAIQTVSLFTVPKKDVEVPTTTEATGVTLSDRDTVVKGETVTLDYHILPISVAEVTGSIQWSSDNPSVATVNNGVVTGVSAGKATITAKVGNFERKCVVTVTENARKFYGYSENDKAWISFDEKTGAVTIEHQDAQGESPISAAFYNGNTIYAYTEDGKFWEINPDTFERTEKGKGVSDVTIGLTGQNELGGVPFTENVKYVVGDLTWDYENEKLYATMEAIHYSFIEDSFSSVIFEVDLEDGTIEHEIAKGSTEEGDRPVAIIYRNGRIYEIDGFASGMVYTVDVSTGRKTEYALFENYWGDFNGGRSLIEDPLTGKVYGIRDLNSVYYTDFDDWKEKGYDASVVSTCSELIEIGMGTALAKTDMCDIGNKIVVNSLFIK